MLRLFVWKYSFVDTHSTVGQRLLGIKYEVGSNYQLWALVFLDILTHWVHQRQSLLLAYTPLSDVAKSRVQQYTTIGVNISRILNSFLFLQRGTYPALATLMLRLRHTSTTTEENPNTSTEYSYMSR